MKNCFCTLVILTVLGCTPSQNQTDIPPITEVHSEELIDIQINKEGIVRINGQTVQESAIASHISGFQIDSMTSIRMILHEEANTGTVNKVTRSLAFGRTASGTELRLNTRMLSQEDFEQYLKREIHIDVLSNDRILYNGNLLFAEDLITALGSEPDSEKPVFLSISNEATFEQVLDVQKQINLASFTLFTNN